MKYCKNCQTPYDDDAQFCVNCGSTEFLPDPQNAQAAYFGAAYAEPYAVQNETVYTAQNTGSYVQNTSGYAPQYAQEQNSYMQNSIQCAQVQNGPARTNPLRSRFRASKKSTGCETTRAAWFPETFREPRTQRAESRKASLRPFAPCLLPAARGFGRLIFALRTQNTRPTRALTRSLRGRVRCRCGFQRNTAKSAPQRQILCGAVFLAVYAGFTSQSSTTGSPFCREAGTSRILWFEEPRKFSARERLSLRKGPSTSTSTLSSRGRASGMSRSCSNV